MSTDLPSLTLAEYLEKQPGTSFRRLYQLPSATLAIFRHMLPGLSKTIATMLIPFDHPIPLSEMDNRFVPDAKKEKDKAYSALRSMHIIQVSAPTKDRPQEIGLTASFKKSYMMALKGNGKHRSFGVPVERQISGVDIKFLDRYARQKWEEILHYVVSSVEPELTSSSSGPKSSVKELLLAGRLVERRDSSGVVGITNAGFTFLLQSANAQVWTLLLQWLEAVDKSPDENKEMDGIEMLGFMLMLSNLQLGKAYDTNALDDKRKNLLPYLVDFGLIYIPPSDRESQYFPTRLATTLTSARGTLRDMNIGFQATTKDAAAASGLPSSGEDTSARIILETNFRVYAYTSSPLQIAVLSLFVKLSTRYPNMVTGKLTRDSVRRAVSFGITSEQAIQYLVVNAHEQMHKHAANTGKPLLPPTVVDQIRLWQLETERMKSTKGFLFKEFDTTKEYEALTQYADEIGVLVWKSDLKQEFFVTKHEQLGAFLKARKRAEA